MNEIKTKKEYLETLDYIVKKTAEALNISERSARLRANALLKSGLLDKYKNADDILFKIVVDTAMQIPQLGKRER